MMKPQLYPRSLAKGAILYKFDAYTDDDGETTIDREEWVVRSIQCQRRNKLAMRLSISEQRPKYVFLTQRIDFITWYKDQWVTSISPLYKTLFRCGERLPDGMYTTLLKALKSAIHRKADDIERIRKYKAEESDPQSIREWDEDLANSIKEHRLMRTHLTRLKNTATKA